MHKGKDFEKEKVEVQLVVGDRDGTLGLLCGDLSVLRLHRDVGALRLLHRDVCDLAETGRCASCIVTCVTWHSPSAIRLRRALCARGIARRERARARVIAPRDRVRERVMTQMLACDISRTRTHKHTHTHTTE